MMADVDEDKVIKERTVRDETVETCLTHIPPLTPGSAADRPTLEMSIGRDFYLRKSRRRQLRRLEF